MSLAQNSNASAASLEPGGSRAPSLRWPERFGSFYRLHDRVVLGFAQKFWFSIQGKPILYFKGLSFGYFSTNRYATDRVTGCSSCVIYFICPCVKFRRQESLSVFRSTISATHHNNNDYKRHSILRRELF